ncbi:jacalin-related lectin 3 [Salvia hispanica]|uniref:jacalin-related lectin 3 n=1 Tax=Salvia hispanica TaxID=49212 RepID=UPI0020096FE6|nr:jacalin-related lectin 3 [Salvia hispanica]
MNYGKQTVLVGPWGGQEGQYWDDGVYSTVRQLEISHGDAIDSIRIEYEINGRSIWSEIHGGSGGSKIDKIRLDYPDEYLTSAHGYFGHLHERGPVFVRALSLESNKRRYGPFGVEQGTYFSFPKIQGRIVGFLGKSGWFLDAIGAYIEPFQNHHLASPNSIYYSQLQISQPVDKNQYSMIQGSLGADYDLIVAVRQKDTSSNHHDYANFESSNTKIHKHVSFQRSIQNNHVSSDKIIENSSGVVTSGPWGGGGGSAFDDGVYDGVRQINLSRNVCIVAVRVCYERNGEIVWGSKNGGTGAFKTDKVVFDYPSEILTHLTGYMGPTMIMGPSVVKSLTFHTTKGKYGPYGEEEGEFFSTKLKEGSMIVGFHGRRGLFLDAIGVHVLEGKVANASPAANAKSSASGKVANVPPTANDKHSASKATNQAALVAKKAADGSEWPFKFGKRGQTDEVVHPAPYGPGPWGGEGGKPWDDGVFTGIKQIILTITDAICCVEIEYDRNGQSVWSVKHGGTNGQTANRVKLDYPNEVLTCISGYYGSIKSEQGSKVIRSLTFHTSRKKYGPFGEETGTYFTSGTTEGKVVGFHGKSSTHLDAIGVHMQHWLGNRKTPKASSSLMKYFS